MINVDNVVAEARALEAEFKAGNLSANEYTDLLRDLQRTKAIQAAAGNLATLTQLNKLIYGLISIASVI